MLAAGPLADPPLMQMAVAGEDVDLVQFAMDLEAAGVKFFGAAWCPHCTAQKKLFEDGYQFLPFIEVTNPDHTLNQTGIDEGISAFPTWEFAGGARVEGELTLEEISDLSGVAIPTSDQPFLAPIADAALFAGAPLHIPLDGYDPNGGELTYSVTVSNATHPLRTLIPEGNRSLHISMANYGDMVIELFETRVPRVTEHIIALAEEGFYDGVGFHRIINGFMIQGGDPTGTGSGGSYLGDFDDQFHVDLQHTSSGLISMAKTVDDTNDSQFFITEVATRHLDFNHSVFGRMTEGEDVRETLSNIPTNASAQPGFPAVMQSVEVFADLENAVLMIDAPADATGSADVTVTVTDGDGNEFSRTFHVTYTPDPSDGNPFLEDIGRVETTVDTTVTFQIAAVEPEGENTFFIDEAALDATEDPDNPGFALFVPFRAHPDLDYSVDFETGLVTVTPTNGLVGTHPITLATARFTNFIDYQVVPIFIAPSDPVDARVELSLVASATVTADGTGEVVALPAGKNWVSEWGSFWVEVWVSTPGTTDFGVAGADVDLSYDPAMFTATAIEFGHAYRENQAGTIDNAAGTITGMGASTTRYDVGDDRRALLARVQFKTTGAVPIGPDGLPATAFGEASFALDAGAVELVVGESQTVLGPDVAADVWPVLFDVDDSSQIGFGDFALFASAFLQDASSSPLAARSDFNHDGRVDFGDFALLASNFLKTPASSPVVYPANYPAAWHSENLLVESSVAPPAAAPVLSDADLAPIADAALARLSQTLDSEAVDELRRVTFLIADLPDDRLAAASGDIIWIDRDAAGYGWFVDASPLDDVEFFPLAGSELRAAPGSGADGRVDLLTAVMHEFGHHLGLGDTGGDDLMGGSLPIGLRRLPPVDLDVLVRGDQADASMADHFFTHLGD